MVSPDTGSTPIIERIHDAVISGEVSIPPLPEITTRLMTLLGDDSTASATQVAEMVHNDPAVAATLLRMANSAAFGGLRPISNLSHAIARLGLGQVTSVVTALMHQGHFETNDPAKKALLSALWDHALATAVGTKALSIVASSDPEEGFLAGLLHDVGKLLILKGVDWLEDRCGTTVTPVVLAEMMETLHTELGFHTLTGWHLPEPICRAARDHHNDDVISDDLIEVRVQAADAIARKLGAHPTPEPDLHLLQIPAIERMGLGDVELAALMVDLEDEIAEVTQIRLGSTVPASGPDAPPAG
ncbi:MAG: HDOD domain-containing protein [Acidobacteriota bacterium]